MRYDFDMFSVIPDEVRQQFQGMLNDVGAGAMATQQTALWRDPAVVAALQGADESVKQLFWDAGFGINQYDSGAPNDRFLSRDAEERDKRIWSFMELFANRLMDGSMKGANWNGFDPHAFLEHAQACTAIDEVEVAAMDQAPNTQVHRKSSKIGVAPKKMVAMAGFSVGVVALGAAVISAL